jgi:hypothetical protein
MIALDGDQLAHVCGGQTTNQTGADGVIVDSNTTRSNYGYCVDQVTQQTAAAYPDTRPSILGVPLPFTTDDNAAARGKATMENMVATCGQPPG